MEQRRLNRASAPSWAISAASQSTTSRGGRATASPRRARACEATPSTFTALTTGGTCAMGPTIAPSAARIDSVATTAGPVATTTPSASRESVSSPKRTVVS
ncbi:MAG: hypothetical protein U0325_03220 [Polyangiales bacterium]